MEVGASVGPSLDHLDLVRDALRIAFRETRIEVIEDLGLPRAQGLHQLGKDNEPGLFRVLSRS